MISTVGTLVIVLFGLTGGYYLVRFVLDRRWEDRVLNGSHLAMSVLMIMMPLGWSIHIPAAPQLVVFTAAALWYAYLLLFRPYAVSETAGSHHSGRPRLLYHTGMMLAMVWMAVIMAPVAGAVGPVPAEAAMIMPGMISSTTTTPVVPATHGWAGPVSIMIGSAFGVATVWYVARFVLAAGTPGQVNTRRLAYYGSAALMAAGMALSNLVLM